MQKIRPFSPRASRSLSLKVVVVVVLVDLVVVIHSNYLLYKLSVKSVDGAFSPSK